MISNMTNTTLLRRCSECGKMDLNIATISSYTAKVKHDGSVHTFLVPDLHVWKCTSCGDILFDDRTDDQMPMGCEVHRPIVPSRNQGED